MGEKRRKLGEFSHFLGSQTEPLIPKSKNDIEIRAVLHYIILELIVFSTSGLWINGIVG